MSELQDLAQQYLKLSIEIKEMNEKLQPQKDKQKEMKGKILQLMIESGKNELDMPEGKFSVKTTETPETINKKVIASALAENYSTQDADTIATTVLQKRTKKKKTDLSLKMA